MAVGREVGARKRVLSEKQLKALRTYIVKKKKKDIENEAREESLHGRDSQNLSEHSDASRLDKCTGNDLSITRSSDTSDTGCTGILVKETTKEESLEDVTQQLKSLRENLEHLKKEKHRLFQELKKVLHEEDEKKRVHQMEQQRHEQELISSDVMFYRGDPRLGKAGMKHPWSTFGSPEPLYTKLPRTGSVQEMQHYTQQHSPRYHHPPSDTEKYPLPFLQRGIPPGHMMRPPTHSMSPGYQYRGHQYMNYTSGNTSQYSGLTSYQGVSYIQPGTPSRTELLTGQGVMYQTHHPYMSQMITPREYTQTSHFPFEPRQMRFMMRGQRPPLKMTTGIGYPSQPEPSPSGSPSHSPVPSNERIRYMPQQRTSKK